MASCKDCIHEEVCNYFEVDLNEEGAEKCVCFKDRNRFVELPCSENPYSLPVKKQKKPLKLWSEEND